jgi:hypothetical protein
MELACHLGNGGHVLGFGLPDRQRRALFGHGLSLTAVAELVQCFVSEVWNGKPACTRSCAIIPIIPINKTSQFYMYLFDIK